MEGLDTIIRSLRLVVFDFDGVFTDNTVYVDQDGKESVRCWRGDGLGLQKLTALGIEKLILSTETNPVVTVRANKLKIRAIQGCNDKLKTLQAVTRELNIPLAETAYMGNDINDAACLQEVGLPVIVQDAHEDVVPYALYRTTRPGGFGAVRELCDLIEQMRKLD